MTRIHFRSVGLALAAVLFAAGCSDSTGPDGAPTDLTVRVYVDADGSGTFNAGDAPVAGATVTATSEDGTAATATSDAQGAAQFPGLRPGTYTLSLSGAAPAGAVLATARTPVFTATALGGTATTDFRFSYFPGTVTGVMYRDDNGNGTFEPAQDQAAAGITVNLYAGTTATGDPISTTTTDADGTYLFQGVRPGTYTVEVEAPATVTIEGGATRQVVVPAAGPVTADIRFTGSLRIPIAQARTRAPNTNVTVEGVVTAGRGQLGSRNFYVQDASGGIQVFLPSAHPAQPALGDSVRVTGGIGVFNGEVQISAGSIIVEALGTGRVPAPREVDGPEVMAYTYEGQLLQVDSLTVVSIQTFGSPVSSANVTVSTPQGNQFQVRLDNAGNVPPSSFQVGSVYTVTGVMGQRNGVPQLKPRSTGDVARTDPISIAGARVLPAGTVVTVTGVMTTPVGVFATSGTGATQIGNFYFQDATGGIQAFGGLVSAGLAPGDSVQVTGTIGFFNGEVQITTPLTVVPLGTTTVPAPRVVTGNELRHRAFEGQLARINDVVVTNVGSQSSTTSSFSVTARAPDGTVFTIRAEGRTNVDRPAFTVGQTYDIVGILSVFSGVGQIKPRSTDDVIAS